MAFKAGTVSFFNLANAAASLTNLSPYIDKTTVPNTTQMLDVSVFGTAAKGFIPGLTNGDVVALSGPYDSVVALHIGSLIAAQNAGTASHAFQWGPGGSVAGQAKVTGTVLVASYTLDSAVGARVNYSANLQITGAVTNASW